MFIEILEELFDPNHDFKSGVKAGRNAGAIEQLLHEVIPISSKGFDAGFEKGLAEQDDN